MNFNKTILVGRLTKAPELRKVGEKQVVSFTVASNRSFSNKSGEKSEKTLFMDCEIWGTPAGIIADKAVKGTEMLVEGPLEQDTYQGKDGQKRTRYKLKVEFFQFGRGSNYSQSAPTESAPAPAVSDDDAPF